MAMRSAGVAVAAIFGLGNLFASGADLKPGDKAPDFTMVGSDGKVYRLADFSGKQAVVLAWFPKAFTPGCTNQCKSMRSEGDSIRDFNVAYFTASCDTVDLNRDFAKSLELDYPILSDPTGDVARAYGVLGTLIRLPQRWTFYIGKDGKILHIDKSVNTATHGADVAKKLAELGVERREP